ncbi:hypothetical protein QJS10_CPA16g01693 [Acorus calamus]|uniref:Transmembrane protein n=1 Tax=Acorus calamus TaxID=4465 RepID=A0AAV9CYC3_ACOCL|nr:hypothetical protein QJS10_CPA16g01693 [Acorus calamus]
MELTSLREMDPVVDLESGGTTSEEDAPPKEIVSVSQQSRKLFGGVWNGFVGIDGLARGLDAVNNSRNSPSSSVDDNGEFRGQESVGMLEKRLDVEKPKKKGSKKPPKPPRPPKGPLLDAADQKLVKEISELAMLKRARAERMKALKKMKASKTSSSSSSCSSVFAMVVTVLFCLMLILPGLCSRSSSNVRFQGSPESSVTSRGGLISVQYHKNVPPNSTRTSDSASPNAVERVSGLGMYGEHRKLMD